MQTPRMVFGRGFVYAGMLLIVATGGTRSVASAETVYWTGATSIEWANSGNWTNATGDAVAPGPGTNVVINGAPHERHPAFTIGSSCATIGALTIGENAASQLTINDNLTVTGNVQVGSLGSLLHGGPAAYQTHPVNRLELTVGGNMTIETGGKIDVTRRGYNYRYGPGYSTGFRSAAHGGKAHDQAAPTYGSITNPVTHGSGGYFGQGGGVALLRVTDTLIVNGNILAQGSNQSGYENNTLGAGGSINLTVGNLAGNGTINAGVEAVSTSANRGAGGGRIAVIVTNNAGFGNVTITAYGRSYGNNSGAAGTIYLRDTNSVHGRLIVDNNNFGTASATTTLICDQVTAAVAGDVTMHKAGRLGVAAGQSLTVYGSWSNAVGTTGLSDAGTVEFAGPDTATLWGSTTFAYLVCTNAGKTLRFEDGKTQTITAGLTFTGAEGNLLTLESTALGVSWYLNQNVVHTVKYVKARDSDASPGSPVLALNSSNVADNVNWVFTELGDVVWTGGADTSTWTDTANWNLGRAPLPDDTSITIRRMGSEPQPVLDINREFNGCLTIEPGATLTLNGRNLTINGAVTNVGIITATGTETLTCRADVDFTGGVFNPAQSKLVLDGAAAQTFKPDGNAFYDIDVPNPDIITVTDDFTARNWTFQGSDAQALFGGKVTATNIVGYVPDIVMLTFDAAIMAETFATTGTTVTLVFSDEVTGNGNFTVNSETAALTFDAGVTIGGTLSITGSTVTNTFSGGLTADTFRSVNTGGGLLTFGAGSDCDIRVLALQGGSGAPLVLRSSSSETPWELNVTGFTSIRFVDVQDSDASGGITIYATDSAGEGANNENWDFGSGKAWVGMTTTWNSAGNWSPAGVPTMTSYVLIDGFGGAQPILDLSGGVTEILHLVVGVTSSSTLEISNGNPANRLVVTGNATIGGHGILTHTANGNYPDPGEVHRLFMDVNGNLFVASGGIIHGNLKGYANNQGPGGYGGSHGGLSGPAGVTTYGSITAPDNLGTSGEWTRGGGAVILRVTGTATIDGMIAANGAGSHNSGSGGSVFITAGSFAGSGSVAANAGEAWHYGHYAGSGGRVALIATNLATAIPIAATAYGGDNTGKADNRGAAGTVYLEIPSGHGMLVIDNAGRATLATVTTLINSNVTGTVVGDVTIRHAARLSVAANQFLSVYGSWSNAVGVAGFAGAGTVEFAGTAPSTIWNNNAWGNLTIATRGKVVRFEAGKTQTIDGTPVFDNGATLLSTVDGEWWFLRKPGDGIQKVGRVSVRDSHAGNPGEHLTFQATGGLDMGNNENWGPWPPLPTVIMLR